MTASARGCLAAVLVLSFAGAARAQESKTAPLAKQLAAAMEAGKLTSLAVADPSQPDKFVAVLYYPGSLLVVTAKYTPSNLMKEKIAKQEYQDVYIDLQSASVAGSKMFVTDTGADGLKMRSPDSVDTNNKSITFDGDWKKSKLASEQDYNKEFSDDDDEYAKMLTALLAGLNKTS